MKTKIQKTQIKKVYKVCKRISCLTCVLFWVCMFIKPIIDSTHIEVRALPGLLAPGVRSMLPWVPLVANSQLSAFRAAR